MLTGESRPNFQFITEKYMEMSERGIKISLDLAQEISDEINSELRGLLGEMLDQIPDEYKDLNLNSTKQVATLMREVLM